MAQLYANGALLISNAYGHTGLDINNVGLMSAALSGYLVHLTAVLTTLTDPERQKNPDDGYILNQSTSDSWSFETTSRSIKVVNRLLAYITAGSVTVANDKMLAYLKEEKTFEESDFYSESEYNKPALPAIPNNPHEKSVFTVSEFEDSVVIPSSVYSLARFNAGIGTWNRIYFTGWWTGLIAYLPSFGPTATQALTGNVSPENAINMITYIIYAERAYNTVNYAEEGIIDFISDIKQGADNLDELQDLEEKLLKDGTLDVEDQFRYEQLTEDLKNNDIGDVGETDTANVAERIRFSEQTILMRNLKEYAQQYVALQKVRKLKYKKTYLMFGKPSTMMNKLTLKPGISSFLNFTTAEVSQLAPKFKLYQLTYDGKNKFKRETEYKFSGKSGIYSKNDETKSILESRGREAVGVKSFEWNYIGTDPITARNDITAELQIFFQSFDDLFEERLGVDDKGIIYTYRYVDLVLRNPIINKEDAATSTTSGSPSNDERPDSEKQKPEKFETKIIVGWNFRGTDFEKKVEKATEGKVTDLSYFNEVLFMTLIDHEFGIEEDGTFNLTINYRARLDAILQDKRSDILATTNIVRARARHEKEIKDAEKACDQDDTSRERLKALKDDYEKSKMRLRKEGYESIIKELTGMEGQDPTDNQKPIPKLYHISIDVAKFVEEGKGELSEIENYLIEPSNSTSLTEEAVKESISSPESVQASPPTYKEAISEASTEVVDEFQDSGVDDAAGAGALGTALLVPSPIQPLAWAWAAGKVGTSAIPILYDAWDTKQIVTNYNNTGELDPEDANKYLLTTVDQSADKYNIHYFFFGDLIEILANRVMSPLRQAEFSDVDASMSPDQLDNIRILLGSMEWYPRSELKKSKKDGTPIGDLNPYRVVLGALPISLMVWRNFMIRRVIAKKRDVYSLLSFIRDFLKYLLDDVLGGNSEDSEETLKLNIQIKTSVLTMPGKSTGEDNTQSVDPIAEKIAENKGNNISDEIQAGGGIEGVTLDLDKISESNTIIPYGDPESNSSQKAYHYLTVYVENKSPLYLRGKEEEDRKSGVYHFHIGANKTIFKRGSFKKTNATYLREQRFVTENYNPLATLANVYDIEMEMFGNTIFYPGQYLFINPFGLGKSLGFPWDDSSKANIMGLGGYHLVTSVSHTMDEDGFATSVEARFDNSGDGKARRDTRTDTSNPDCPADEATEIR